MAYKKSQMEILGLAIVVVLILMATIFVVRFLIIKEPTDYRSGFVSSELGSNMINTLLRTTSNCDGFSMTELLRDCGQDKSIICGDSKDSCGYFLDTSQQIFTETLEKWKVDYEFKVFNDNGAIITLGKKCILDKKSKLFPIPTDSGIVSVEMDVCG